MRIKAPFILTDPHRFFLEPALPKQRQYEALRAFFVEGHPSQTVAEAFGGTAGAFRVLCHAFCHNPQPAFFLATRPGPRTQPKKSAARPLILSLRKQNHSVYEISELLKEQKRPLSPTAVREVLKAEGFAALPRRRDEERPQRPRPTVEAVADVRARSLVPRQFFTDCGGLFLFLPHLARLPVETLAQAARLPGSKRIPPAHALRACLALKLWSVERKSHVMSLAADEGLALFSGLNVTPKRSFLSEYSCRVTPRQTQKLLAAWHDQAWGAKLWDGSSFNLDFHSVPYYGEHPLVESHYVSMRSRSQPSILAFLAQDEQSQCFCYAHRMLIENSLSDAVQFFHWDALSSAVGLKVDFDMALLVIASGLYRLLARQMRGYAEAHARQIFRDLVNLPAQVRLTEKEVRVEFHRRAHLPIVLASGLCERPVPIPWWENRPLRLTTYTGR